MKIQGPLQSEEARGSVGLFLTFSKRRTGQQVRFQRKQKDAESPGQIIQREKFLAASNSCRFMNYGDAFFGPTSFGVDTNFYNEKAKGKQVTGYNLCISEVLSES